jgi:hypothetical protein
MPYDPLKELKRVTDYYNQDPLQKRFSALITGETNSGKTYLLRTARFPVHIDSFDPDGTKCLSDLIRSEDNPNGQIVADTSYETEDPYNPAAFAKWMKDTEIRLETGYYNLFGTYCLDSFTLFEDSIIGYGMGLKSRAGEVPQHRKDYNPAKVYAENYIKKMMNLTCDFIINGHLKKETRLISIDKQDGIRREETTFRLLTIGQAVITIPLLFSEIYVIQGKGMPPKRKIVTDASGEYLARSRLKRNGLLNVEEEPNIKAILKKAGYPSDDKPRLPKFEKEVIQEKK